MSDMVGAHNDLHSEQGAVKGEHPGRSRNPVIKVQDIAWLEFEKPDLVRAEAFAHAFGFATALRTDNELQLRGTDAGSPCVIIRRGSHTRFVGAAFKAEDEADLLRLAKATGARTRALPETIGGLTRRSGRSGRHTGARGGGHTSTRIAALPDAAHLQLRPRAATRERYAAPAARTHQGAAAGTRGAADDQVRRGAELVPRQPRNDRQRLPVLPRPARPRAGDELHPL